MIKGTEKSNWLRGYLSDLCLERSSTNSLINDTKVIKRIGMMTEDILKGLYFVIRRRVIRRK